MRRLRPNLLPIEVTNWFVRILPEDIMQFAIKGNSKGHFSHSSLIRFCGFLAAMASFCALNSVAAHAQGFTKLADLSTTTGYGSASFTQGVDGNFYGTMRAGGTGGEAGYDGTIFQMTPAGAINVLYNFCSLPNCSDGATPPFEAPYLASDGNFYSAAQSTGGSSIGIGSLFKFTPSGSLTTLYSFCQIVENNSCLDGSYPGGPPVQALDGSFYGTTVWGGSHTATGGTFYRLDSDGTLTTLYSFCALANCADGYQPYGQLVLGPMGNFYGSTGTGGTGSGYGTIFEITPTGKLTTLYNVTTDQILGPMIQATNGNLYGLTINGAYGKGGIFQLTPAGNFSLIYSFCAQTNCPDGNDPFSLMQAPDGNLYGVTIYGGAQKYPARGTIFKVTTSGVFTTLHRFTDGIDGLAPVGIVLGTDGDFYGVTGNGGANLLGTVFEFSAGLHPFVRTVEPGGAVGSTVTILGNGLSGSTAVTFNGTAASFTVASDTAITATVPAGATTGSVNVVTPTGTLTSNVAFRVMP